MEEFGDLATLLVEAKPEPEDEFKKSLDAEVARGFRRDRARFGIGVLASIKGFVGSSLPTLAVTGTAASVLLVVMVVAVAGIGSLSSSQEESGAGSSGTAARGVPDGSSAGGAGATSSEPETAAPQSAAPESATGSGQAEAPLVRKSGSGGEDTSAQSRDGSGKATAPSEGEESSAPDAGAVSDDASGSGGGGGAPPDDDEADSGASSSAPGPSGSGAASGTAAPGAGAAPAAPSTPNARSRKRSVERSAHVVLAARPNDVETVANEVISTTDRFHGIVLESNVRAAGNRGSADFVLRIPSGRLAQALAAYSQLAEVRKRTQDSKDITGTYVDARDALEDARAEQRSLRRQLENADTPEETRRLRSRLNRAGREVTRRKNALSRVSARASNAVVTLSVVSDATYGADDRDEEGAWSVGDALDDAVRVLEVSAGVAMIALAVALPIGLVLAGLSALARTTTRRRRDRALDF